MMNNKKIISRILGIALVLAMVVGAFSMFAISSSASPADAYKLTRGVSFDTYKGTTQADAHAYIYEQTGMYITTQAGTSAYSVPTLISDGWYGYKMYFASMAYMNAQTASNDTVVDSKYTKNADILDLLFSDKGHAKFDIEFDFVVEADPKATSDGGGKPFSPYRGVSMISIGKYNHMFKTTAVGLPDYEVKDDKVVPIEGSAQEGVGYIYMDAKSYSFDAASKIGYSDNTLGTAITGSSNGMMPAKDAGVRYTYKIGETLKIKITIERNKNSEGGTSANNNCATVYVNDQLLGKKNIAKAQKAWGIRFGDSNYGQLSVDNLKISITECDEATHATKWGIETKLVENKATNSCNVVEYCTVCGKTFDAVSMFDKISVTNAKFDGATGALTSSKWKDTGKLTNFKYLRVDTGVISKAATNKYWLVFDYTLEAAPKEFTSEQDFDTSIDVFPYKGFNIVNNMPTSGMYNSLLRLIPDGWEKGNYTKNEATGKYARGTTDGKYVILSGGGKANGGGDVRRGQPVYEISVGETVGFALHVDPVNGQYDVYVNGNYAASGLCAVNNDYASASDTSQYPSFRFADSSGNGNNGFSYKNVALYVDKHEHTKEYSSSTDIGAKVSYDTLNSTYICFCGESVPAGDVKEIIVKTNDVYYGNGAIEGLPTEGEFWLATDYNVRTKEALSADATVLALGDYSVKVSDLGTVSAPNSYSVVAKVKYTAENTADVELYVDGKYIGVKKGVALADATTLNLGDADADTTDIRFYYTKVVKLATDGAVKVTYNPAVDATIKPCAHVAKDGSLSFITTTGTTYETGKVKAVNKLIYSYACSECGERVYLPQGGVLGIDSVNSSVDLDETGSTATPIASSKIIVVDRKDVSIGSGAYWVSFDFKADFTEDYIKLIKKRTDGTESSRGTSIFSLRVPYIDPAVCVDGSKYGADYANTYKTDSTDTTYYLQFMRAVSAPEEYENAIGINFYEAQKSDPKHSNPTFIMKSGETYNVAILVEPEADGVSYKAYIDGKLMEERTEAGTNVLNFFDIDRDDASIIDEAIANNATNNGKRRFQFRFLDRNSAGYSVSNFAIVRAVSAEHTHSDDWATDEDRSVVVTDKAVESYYKCYCGEDVLAGQISNVFLNNYPTVYENHANDEDAPTEAYWYTTELNLRDEKASFAAIKLNGVEIKYADGKILVNEEDTGIAATAPNSYVIAVEMQNELYRVYIDGKFVANGEGENLLAEGVVYTEAGESVRFNCNKLVALGDTAFDGEIIYYVDDSVRPCAHSVSGFMTNIVRDSDGNMTYTDKCSKCGEIIYDIEIVDSYANGDIYATYNNNNIDLSDDFAVIPGTNNSIRVFLSDDFIGKDIAPYQLDITLTLDKVASESVLANVASAGHNQGRNLINSHKDFDANSGIFDALVRQFPAYDENGKAYSDRIEIRSGNSAKSIYIDTMFLNETKALSLYFHPDTNLVDIYVNGEYKITRAGGYDSTYKYFRMNDGGGCEFTVTDFKFIRPSELAHTHTDRYLDAVENIDSKFDIVKTENGNKVEYSFDCYCGERVTYSIDSVNVDAIAPSYGISKAVEVGTYNFNTEGNAFVAGFAVRNLPTERTVIAKLGEYALISVDENGSLFIGNSAVAANVSVTDDSNYHTLAVLKRTAIDETYRIFVDGELIGFIMIHGDDFAVTVGAENGEYHFDEMASVALAERENGIAYQLDTKTHSKHTFDPYTAELVFNAEKTTITVDYVCTICDRPAQDGIVTNLATVVPSLNNKEACETVVIENIAEAVGDRDNFWLSLDMSLVKAAANNGLALIRFGETDIVTIDATGAIKANGVIIGSLTSKYNNITVGVVGSADVPSVYVYVNGIYCAEVALDGSENTIVVGNAEAVINFKDAKFVEMGNDGSLIIGAYDCGEGNHVFDKTKATVSYIDPSVFEYSYSCRFCGLEITERPSTKYVYSGISDVRNWCEVSFMWGEDYAETPNSYWIVSDVNRRSNLGVTYDDYSNIIGENGYCAVLVKQDGSLFLGDGTKLNAKLSGKTTLNIAVLCELGEEGERTYTVYIDGKFAGQTTGDIVYKYEVSEYFTDSDMVMMLGDSGIIDVKFYNNKYFTSAPTDDVITFTFEADEYSVPCAHSYNAEESGAKTVILGGEYPTTVYFCAKCGERVYSVADTSIFNPAANTGFVLGENNSITISNTKTLAGSEDTMGPAATPYWLTFDLVATKVNANQVGAQRNNVDKGRNFINFGSNYNSPLRLFAVEDGFGGYLQDRLEVRENNVDSSKKLFTIVKDEKVSVALYVNPAETSIETYVNGEYVATRYSATHATNFSIRFLDGAWGTFVLSNFKMVSDVHVHTSEYSEMLGGEDVLVYGDNTLTHRYTCYCGAELVEGISTIHANAIKDVTTSVEKAIAEGVVINANSYWLSAKVIPGAGASNIYSYNGEYLVDITDGYYRVGEVATEIAPSFGAYDIVSVKVYPNEDRYLVYIDGKFVGAGRNIDFTPGEAFNIKLGGGGVSNTFQKIKLVTLLDGATGTVADCGDHSFDFGSVTATVTPNGIEYKCLICDAPIRTVTIGNGAKFEKTDKVTSKQEGGPTYDLTAYRNTIFSKDLDGTFFISFDITPIADGTKGAFEANSDTRRSLITWLSTNSEGTVDYNQRLLNVWKTNDKKIADITYRVNGNENVGVASPTGGITQIEQGNKYTFLYEIDPDTGMYDVYINGVYSGRGGAINIDRGADYKYQFRYNNVAGCYEYENLKIFKPETVKDTDPIEESKPVALHVHKPAKNGDNITYVDGKLNHSFTCSSCKKEVVLTSAVSLLPEGTKTNLVDVVGNNTLHIGSTVTNKVAPYWITFDFTADNIGVAGLAIAANTSKGGMATTEPGSGRSFVSIESLTSNQRVHLLRGFAHKYVEGEGYDKFTANYKDEFGNVISSKNFADGVMDLRVCGNKNSDIITTVKVGDTIKLAYYVIPTTGEIWIYLDKYDGEGLQFVTTHKDGTANGKNCACRSHADSVYAEGTAIRFMDGAYGMYDFTNIQVTRLTDSCLHENPKSCTEGATYTCDCGLELATVHNYTVSRDNTGMWNVYSCADCDSYYLEFADESVLDDVEIVFANDKAVWAYLVKTYPPLFIKK